MPKTDRRDSTVLQAVLDLSKQVAKLDTDLAVNTHETTNNGARLDKVNGSVAKHEAAIASTNQNFALLSKTVDLHQQILADSKKEKTNWLDWLLKGAVALGLLLLYSLLTKAGIVSDFLH